MMSPRKLQALLRLMPPEEEKKKKTLSCTSVARHLLIASLHERHLGAELTCRAVRK